jgi:hypothetical protein
MKIPRDPVNPGGGFIDAHGRIESAITEPAIEVNEFVAVSWDINGRVDWCDDFEQLICGFDTDGQTLIVRRRAKSEELKRLRVPVFIQSDEWPVCCARSMSFVGQIDDNAICQEPPPGRSLWWHDAASFYVFTCAVCLECKAIGQQF